MYIPDESPVIDKPVCDPTFGDQLYVNGGFPAVIIKSIVPSFPSTGSVFINAHWTGLDGSIYTPVICWQPVLSVTVRV